MLKQILSARPFTKLNRTKSPASAQLNQEAVSSPSESVTLSNSSKSGTNWRNGKLAKTALAVGLAASLMMGMAGCTTMTTHCGPMGCVTTEQIDPVGTAIAVGVGAVILDSVLEDAYHNQHHHHHGGYEHYHEHHGHHGHHHPGHFYYQDGGYILNY